MKRRWLKGFTLCVAALLTGLICSCGKSEILNPENPTRVIVWNYYSGYQQQAFTEMVEEFNRTIGIEKGIIIESVAQGSVDGMAQELLDSMEEETRRSDLPDVVSVYPDTAYELDKCGLLVSIEDYFSKEEMEEFIPAFLEAGRMEEGGDVKLIPICKSTEILLYNKTDFDRFAAATNVKETDMATMEGIVEVSRKYYEWTDSLTPGIKDDGKAFFGRDSIKNYVVIGAKQLGHPILEGEEETWEPDKETFRTLWNTYYVPYINGYFGSYGNFSSDDAKTGHIIAGLCSSSGVGYFPQKVTLNNDMSYDIVVGICPAPTYEGGTQEALLQGAGYAILRSDEQKQYAAAEFLKWITGKERNMEFSIAANYMPVKKDSITKEALEEYFGDVQSRGTIQESMKLCSKLVEEGSLWADKPSEHYGDIRSYLADSLEEKAKTNRASIEKMMEKGISREEAIAAYDTEKNFEKWYQSIVTGVKKELENN